jgi:hypothetical protein
MHGLAEVLANSSGTNELPAATPAAALSRLILTSDGEHELAALAPDEAAVEALSEPLAFEPGGAASDPHAATANVPAANAATASGRGLSTVPPGCRQAAGIFR